MFYYYVLMVWNNVKPELFGPFNNSKERDLKAKELRKEHGKDHGLFHLESQKTISVDSYEEAFLDSK